MRIGTALISAVLFICAVLADVALPSSPGCCAADLSRRGRGDVSAAASPLPWRVRGGLFALFAESGECPAKLTGPCNEGGFRNISPLAGFR
jgi:hypothetical protein